MEATRVCVSVCVCVLRWFCCWFCITRPLYKRVVSTPPPSTCPLGATFFLLTCFFFCCFCFVFLIFFFRPSVCWRGTLALLSQPLTWCVSPSVLSCPSHLAWRHQSAQAGPCRAAGPDSCTGVNWERRTLVCSRQTRWCH